MPIILNGTTGITTPGITNTGPFTFQGVVELPAGAVGAPSLTTTGDTNTGIYFPAADTIGFVEGGVESARFDSSGNLGIGTASPEAYSGYKTLEVQGSTGGVFQSSNTAGTRKALFTVNATGAVLGTVTNSPLILQTNNSEKTRIDAAGNMGLGVTPSAWNSGVKALDINNGASFIGTALAASMWSNSIVDTGPTFRYRNNGVAAFYDQAGGAHAWYTAASGTAGNVITFGDAKMTLNQDGNLGLGVTPSAWNAGGNIQVQASKSLVSTGDGLYIGSNYFYSTDFKYTSSTFASYYLQISGQHRWYTAPSGTAGNNITFTQAMTLTSNGNLLLSRTSDPLTAGARLVLQGPGDTAVQITKEGVVAARVMAVNTALAFGVDTGDGATERARITSGGVLLVGATAGPSGATELIAGSVFVNSNLFIGNSNGTTGYAFRFDGFANELYAIWSNASGVDQGGVKLTYAGTSWSSASDIREKQIIENIENAVDKLSGLRTVIGRYNNDDADKRRSFLIAQDVETVFPEAVSASKKKDSDEERLWLNYQDLIPVLVKAIQELKAELDALKGLH